MDERWISSGFSCDRGIASEERGSRVSPLHTREQLQINSLQQQPPVFTCCNMLCQHSQSTGKFLPLWGGGWGRQVCGLDVVIVMLCNWQVCSDPVSDANIPLNSSTGVRRQTCLLIGTWKNMPGWQGYSGLFIWLTHSLSSIKLIPTMCEPNTMYCPASFWAFLLNKLGKQLWWLL